MNLSGNYLIYNNREKRISGCYKCNEDHTLSSGSDLVGTWSQYSDGVNATFAIAFGQNAVIDGSSNLAFVTGTYAVSTGSMTGNLHVMIGAYAVTPVTGSVSASPPPKN